MSLVHLPGKFISFECEDALDDHGYVLYLKSNGKVAKCAAGAVPIGVNFKDTKNPITGTAEEDRNVPVQLDGVADVMYYLAAGDDDISIGDLVMAHQSQAGYITKYTTDQDSKLIVGIALESATAPAEGTKTGHIKVLLRCGRR